MTNETSAVKPLPETAAPAASPETTPAQPEAADGRPAVRYMDDATFQRSLEKVVIVHDRLLAELAK